MTCKLIPGGIACNFTDTWVYVCFEHTTYIMEFSRLFGPFWRRLEGDKEIEVTPEPEGHLAFLWDIFDDWYRGDKTL